MSPLTGGVPRHDLCLAVVPAISRIFCPAAYRLYVKSTEANLYAWLVPPNVTLILEPKKAGGKRGRGKVARQGSETGFRTAPQAVIDGVMERGQDGVKTPVVERPPGAEGVGSGESPGGKGPGTAGRGSRGGRAPAAGPPGGENAGNGPCGGRKGRSGRRSEGALGGVGGVALPRGFTGQPDQGGVCPRGAGAVWAGVQWAGWYRW